MKTPKDCVSEFLALYCVLIIESTSSLSGWNTLSDRHYSHWDSVLENPISSKTWQKEVSHLLS